MEFSKKIVVWAILATSGYIILSLVLFYLRGNVSSDLTDLMGMIVTGVIISYAGKAGLENYQKIKQGGHKTTEKGENEL